MSNDNNLNISIKDLVDRMDDLLPEESTCILHEEEYVDLIETLLYMMDDYIENYPKAISEEDFHEEFKEHVLELMMIIISNNNETISLHEEKKEEFMEQLEIAFDYAEKIFFENIIPVRSFPYTFIMNKPNFEKIQKQIIYLSNVYQPAQRTAEWYTYRRDLITASNAYKAFESQSAQNQLIYEKCKTIPVIVMDENINIQDTTRSIINTNSSLHWGQKYEPLSVMLYEYMYSTKIGDFGCIKHPSYPFLGASPDGINIDPLSDRFGRMLEIKNVVNREITGVPKKEYWIQTQLQMEVCDLDECDFLETKFVEYEDYDAFSKDGTTFHESLQSERKGSIIQFIKKDGNPLYVYQPCSIETQEEFNDWEEKMMDKYENEGLMWLRNIYWKLEVFSCVLILRNKKWFQANIGGIESIWKTIEKERVEGFEHRAPNKRAKKEKSNSFDCLENNLFVEKCFLGLDKETGKVRVHED